MRSTKYHDYRVLKIALFIILVILGLFIYIKCTRALHEHTATQWTTITEATCTEDGLEAKICTDPECEGARFDERIIPATGHTESSKWTTVEKATCTEQGVETKLCKDCGLVLDTRYTNPIPHDTAVRYENVNPATCTENGSRDVVTYCKDCGHVTGSDIETLPATGHSYGEVVGYQISEEPTHTEGGVKLVLRKCNACGETHPTEAIELDPIGHTYVWELKHDSETGEFTMVGTCDCDEAGNKRVYSAADGLVIETDGVPNCCVHKYIGTMEIDDVKITREIVLENESHKIEKILVLDGNEYVEAYVPIAQYKQYDEKYGVYYDISVDNLYTYVSLVKNNEWDENGFAWGVFKCVQCEDMNCPECNGDYYYVVRVYNPKYDTRLSGESVDD